MANFVVDFGTDRGYQLLNQIATKHSLPAYVLTENTHKLAGDDSRHSCALLAPEPRFPTDSKAACWLSHAYYVQQRDKLSAEDQQKAERFLLKRASFWGIAEDVQQMISREAEVIKQAEAVIDEFPLRSDAEIKAAAEWLLGGYAAKQAHQIPIGRRIELAERLLDAGAERFVSAEQAQTLHKAACRRGCYNGRRVAEKLAGTVIMQPHAVANKLSAVLQDIYGPAMQAQHKSAAMVCDKHRVFGDSPAELELAVDTAEPVVIFPSGSVLTKAAADAFESRETKILRSDLGRLTKVALSTLIEELGQETADKMERTMHDAGVRFVARAPRENYAIDFSLIR